MNRQQRRREKRKEEKKDVVYNLTQNNIQAIHVEARKQAFQEFKLKQKELFNEYAKKAIDESFELSLGIFLLFLRDKHGYGGRRLRRSMEELVEYYNDWSKERFSIKDVVDTIKEETGYSFNFETNLENREIKLYDN